MPQCAHRFLLLSLLLAGCAGGPDPDAIRALPADAVLDARGLGRGAAERPAQVQVRPGPNGLALLTVSPRLQTGSPGSLPMIVTDLGAERPEAGPARPTLLVEVSNARGYGGFARAETRQGTAIAVQALGRRTECAAACLYVETLLLSLTEEELRRTAEAGTGLRIRLHGNAAFVEVGVPSGHVRALAAALASPLG